MSFILVFFCTAGNLFSQPSSIANQVTPEFFGVDFWGSNPQIWQQFFALLDEDNVPFGLAGVASLGWEIVEPDPPGNGNHTYDWSLLDDLVRVVFEAGRVIDLELLPRSNWATVVPVSEMDELCCDMSSPKEDADSDIVQWGMTAYQAWDDFVFHLVERYDGTVGQLIRTLVDEQMPAGEHRVIWNGRDKHGQSVASGVYMYKMQVAGQGLQKKLVLLR